MNILIVDDEKMVRNWLEMFLRQVVETDDLQILTASSAEQALSICDGNPYIDLLITDIRMAKMSGLDLIIELEKKYPKINTAVLSTYDDFQYVRTAMKHGAIDYILKSDMQISDIEALIEKIRLLSKPVTSNTQDETPFINMNSLFKDYLEETITIHNLLSIFPGLSDERFSVIIFKLANQDHISETDLVNVCKLTLEGEKLHGYLFTHENRCIVIYHSAHTISEDRVTQLNKLIILLERNLNERLSCSISEITGESFSTISSVDNFLHAVFRYVSASRYYGGQTLHEKDLIHVDGDEIRTISDELYFNINHRRYDSSLDLIESFVERSHASHVYPSEIKGVVIHWLTILYSNYNSAEQVTDIITKYQITIKQIYGSHTAEELSSSLQQFHITFLSLAEAEHYDIMHPTIREALAYIDSHFSDQFSLDDLAVYVSMNKSYFSHLFSKETGMNFTDYLEQVRIFKAQILLRDTSDSIASISEQVGYTSQSYFSKAFKKNTGITPNTYRASFRD